MNTEHIKLQLHNIVHNKIYISNILNNIKTVFFNKFLIVLSQVIF